MTGRRTLLDELMAEFINYGGMVATRSEVFAYSFEVYKSDAIAEGCNRRKAKQVAHKWADTAAFGPNTQKLSVEEVEILLQHGLRFDPQTGDPVKRKRQVFRRR